MADEAVKSEFSAWLEEKLLNLLGFPPEETLINYYVTLESPRAIEEQLSGLVDIEQPEGAEFLKEFLKRWKVLSVSKGINKPKIHELAAQSKVPQQPRSELRKQTKGNNLVNLRFAGVENEENEDPIKQSVNNPPPKMTVDTRGAEFLDKNSVMEDEVQQKVSPFKKKHVKYVPLFGQNGRLKTDTALLPGRYACQCLAQKHDLINNCVECGRIVCAQEGSGPCLFCGNLVCSQEEQEILLRESKKSKKLMEKLMGQEAPVEDESEEEEDKALQKAIAHRNKLLDFDKNCTKRTKVLDDEADYFTSDSRWLSKNQKEAIKKRDEELREKRFTSRRNQKFTLDFAGRKVVQDETQNYMYDEEDAVLKSIGNNTSETFSLTAAERSDNPLIDPRITIKPPKFSSDGFQGDVTQLLKSQQEAVKNSLRIQDKGLQEMGDPGMCMSMHQPWASLLVCGIKRLEGRSWYSAHRGRLWIASTAQPADRETIQQIENQYRYFFPDEDLNFPSTYPSGVLLGCVTVTDCASNEEYFKTAIIFVTFFRKKGTSQDVDVKNQHPNCQEESNSAYLFVCEHPQELRIKQEMKGKHKIYKLDPRIHAAAKTSLVQ